jgi:hypothetical protein
MGEQILRKELHRKVFGKREFVENEIHKINDFLTEADLQLIAEFNSADDVDTAYEHGVWFGFDWDISTLELPKLIIWAGNFLHDYELDEPVEIERGTDYFAMKVLKAKLENYKDFTVWL